MGLMLRKGEDQKNIVKEMAAVHPGFNCIAEDNCVIFTVVNAARQLYVDAIGQEQVILDFRYVPVTFRGLIIAMTQYHHLKGGWSPSMKLDVNSDDNDVVDYCHETILVGNSATRKCCKYCSGNHTKKTNML